MATTFDNWKYLVLGAVMIVCTCFSISYGLSQINISVKQLNSGLRDGIDSVKGLQTQRNISAEKHFDSIARQLNRIEQGIKK